MKTKHIELLSTTDYGSYILPNMYTYYAEAVAICFEENNFKGTVSLKIEDGETEISVFHFSWACVSQQIKDMHNDLIYETEYGAYCIAFLNFKNISKMMAQIDQFHNQAMDLAEKAFLANQKGDKNAFVQLSKEAFILEKAAAMLLQNQFDAEPSRSILFKSAAFLAYDAQEFQECRDMITYTLLGKPDNIIKAEMNQLFDETTTILKKTTSKLDDLKSKIARLDGGKEILNEIELRFARYGMI